MLRELPLSNINNESENICLPVLAVVVVGVAGEGRGAPTHVVAHAVHVGDGAVLAPLVVQAVHRP